MLKSCYSPAVAAGEKKLAFVSGFIRRPTWFSPPELLLSARRLSTTLVPSAVAAVPPFLIPEVLFSPTPDLLLCSPVSLIIRFLRSSAVATLEVLSRPMQKLADLRFTVCRLKPKYVLTRTNQAGPLWIYHLGWKV